MQNSAPKSSKFTSRILRRPAEALTTGGRHLQVRPRQDGRIFGRKMKEFSRRRGRVLPRLVRVHRWRRAELDRRRWSLTTTTDGCCRFPDCEDVCGMSAAVETLILKVPTISKNSSDGKYYETIWSNLKSQFGEILEKKISVHAKEIAYFPSNDIINFHQIYWSRSYKDFIESKFYNTSIC